MDNSQKNFKKKIFIGIGLLLILLVLILLPFFIIQKKIAQETKKREILKEMGRVEKEIKELEEKKEKVEEKISEILTQIEAKEDIPVKGVEIIKKDDKKLIKNKEQNYEIEIPAQMLLARSITAEELKFFLPDKEGFLSCPGFPSIPPDLEISIEENPENLSIEKWVEKNRKEGLEIQEEFSSYFEEFGWQTKGNNNWYKIEIYVEGITPIVTLEYFLAKGNKIYRAAISAWEKEYCPEKLPYQEIEEILNTFKLI